MVVHFNRLKLCPTNLRSQLQSSQDSTHYQVDDVASHPERSGSAGIRLKVLGQECGEEASILDTDEEMPAEEMPAEETIIEETLDTAEQLVTDQELSNEETLTTEQESITQESSTRR